MLLAVDIGNSNIKFGIFRGIKLLSKFSIPTRRESVAADLHSAVGLGYPISAAIVCSVVPEVNDAMTEFLRKRYCVEPTLVTNDFDFALKINYEPLSDAGTDRIVNAFSAVEKYAPPCIICSFGTALTIDVVDKNRVLLGGLIAPGLGVIAKTLHLNTSRLPDVKIERPSSLIQNTTVGSIQSGVFFGYLSLAKGLISRVKKENGSDPKVIATGGFAPLIAENTRLIDIVDENLLLDGLRLLQSRFESQL